MNTYPGVFFIDAHQTSSGYFFPPNEDPVHHEISHFALDFIQHGIGPALQDAFNSQSIAFRNYSQYDLFTPEYGDTVPALIMGAAGMTYEKGTSEAYAKQVYDHYLAIDTTIKATVQDKVAVTTGWVEQWKEAVDQGAQLRAAEEHARQPAARHAQAGSGRRLHRLRLLLQARPAHRRPRRAGREPAARRRADLPPRHPGGRQRLPRVRRGQRRQRKPFSRDGMTLPAGTFYIPMEQGMKHWIQASWARTRSSRTTTTTTS